ncbi:MAG: hypothetical protein CMA77_05215, partial [Euryarchaeota archaeon]|nr:hypothetical protein [Euryarchaeota archaeon]
MTRARDIASGIDYITGIDAGEVLPHIIPGVLYPAVEGNDLDGTDIDTSHGSTYTYGTTHADGRMYYYTDIKGSKPIKDPRIGAHFGSQRHKFKSLQLLEQETATHGSKVYSVDGREWIRAVGDVTTENGANGSNIRIDAAGEYVEIIGYFIDANVSMHTSSGRYFEIQVDGGSETTSNFGTATVSTPLADDRYVDDGSVINLGLSESLGIHTLRINHDTSSHSLFCVELIAQDTSNRSNIQIPSQNVVSYGKKFTVSGTPHYNPFAQSQTGADVTINSSTTNTAKLTGGWSGTGATYYSSELDTATSLGLSAWVSGGEYFRPVNGGRVIWWVNSSGALKCSVNMMPPAGTAIGGVTGGHNVPTGTHNWATKYQPALHSTTIDHSQEELAKTFWYREFGNGSANGNANYKDASTLVGDGDNDIAYVMDDGLTSISGDNVRTDSNTEMGGHNGESTDLFYMTFIGTGLSHSIISNGTNQDTLANLPYGTHILKVARTNSNTATTTIDGVSLGDVGDNYGYFTEMHIHQPKKPPIPEDAVVLADYMLMADFVIQGAAGVEKLSKGTRILSISRDVFFDGGSANLSLSSMYPEGFYTYGNTNGYLQKLPFFGSGVVNRYEANTSSGSTLDFTNDGTNFSGGTFFGSASSNELDQSTATGNGYFGGIHSLDIGTYTSKLGPVDDNPKYFRGNGYEVITPIHTSFHYQTFETPYLHELVGGDRNMEQHNLVVTPDGKTWDEVTRDTS